MPYPNIKPTLPRRRRLDQVQSERLQDTYEVLEERRKRKNQMDDLTGFKTEGEYIQNTRPRLHHDDAGEAGIPGHPVEEIGYRSRVIGNWSKDAAWQALNKYEKAAAMALLEADNSKGKPDFASARNALGAMINRASKEGQDLGEHVSRSIYEPIIHPQQYYRLKDVTKLPEFKALVGLGEARETGKVDDWVGGATHFITKDPKTMLKLEANDPRLYRSWRGWTGYSDETGQYGKSLLTDTSHAFFAPEGRHSAGGKLIDPPSIAQTDLPSTAGDVNTDDPANRLIMEAEAKQKEWDALRAQTEAKERTFAGQIGDAFEGFGAEVGKYHRQATLPQLPQMQTPRVDPQPTLPEIPRTPPGMPVPDFLGKRQAEARRKARTMF